MAVQRSQNLDAGYDYRPPGLAAPPIAIYQPTFARFRREMVTPTEELVFTETEYTQATHFIDASLWLYLDEKARARALQDIFLHGQRLWRGLRINVNDTEILLDGGHILDLPGIERLCLMLAELKNGGGSGKCDSSDQAERDFMKAVSSKQVLAFLHRFASSADS